jgi:hypothetical protein
MASKTDIGNLALMRLGGPSILSLVDTSKRPIALKTVFDIVLEIVLQDHPWNFAVKRDTLARLSAAPTFGYSYAFQLPSDCLRVLGLVGLDQNVDTTLEYKIEAQQLLTNESTAKLKYISRITDTGKFSPRFCSALAGRLALELSYHLVKSPALQQVIAKGYEEDLRAAKGIDAQEDTPEVYAPNRWVEARA